MGSPNSHEWRPKKGQILAAAALYLPGMLVALPSRRGVGTILNAHPDWSEIEVFHSIERTDVEHFPTDALQRALIGPETRVYIQDGEIWRVGRVKNYDTATLPWIDYTVRFPNGVVDYIPENQLRVRIFEGNTVPARSTVGGVGKFNWDAFCC